MATQLQIRRGTTAQMGAFTGAEGELAVNTSTDTVHVHDGATAGGFALAKADGSNIGTYAGSFTTLAASGASTLTGAVGINIDPTSYKLTVNSGATTETTAAAIGYNGDAGTNLYVNTDHGNNLVSLYASGDVSKEMRFLSGSLEVMRLGTTGNLGVGVTNAADYYANNLVVGAGSEGGITIASSATTYNNYLAFADSSSSVGRYSGLISYDHNINDMHFRTNSLERMRIDASGNVGVGSSSPVSFGANTAGLTVNGSSGSHITWQNNGTNVAFAYPSGNNFIIGSEQSGSNTIFTAAGAERMRILPTGGITFNGDTAEANALDDYEEGTWTPTLAGYYGTYGTTITQGTRSGVYTKVGNLVTLGIEINNAGVDAANNGDIIVITGLPFAITGSYHAGSHASTSIATFVGGAWTPIDTLQLGHLGNNGTSTSSWNWLIGSDVYTSGVAMRLTITYRH